MAAIRVDVGEFIAPFFSDHNYTAYVGSVQVDFEPILGLFTGIKHILMESPPGSGLFSNSVPSKFEYGKAYIPVNKDFSTIIYLSAIGFVQDNLLKKSKQGIFVMN